MNVQFMNGGCGREVNASIMAKALLAGKTLHVSQPFVDFDVADWYEFLRLVWSAYAECSRDNRGCGIKKRISVNVRMGDGRMYCTDVWYDEQSKCMRYVSLL